LSIRVFPAGTFKYLGTRAARTAAAGFPRARSFLARGFYELKWGKTCPTWGGGGGEPPNLRLFDFCRQGVPAHLGRLGRREGGRPNRPLPKTFGPTWANWRRKPQFSVKVYFLRRLSRDDSAPPIGGGGILTKSELDGFMLGDFSFGRGPGRLRWARGFFVRNLGSRTRGANGPHPHRARPARGRFGENGGVQRPRRLGSREADFCPIV